ncbi:hypothetical protein [Croceimicrobium sp.]|uniref:tetratricopeptide repeat protein n=1 Tax=Croceimicrobium sp. TaxID=2828340 RepID=UPI003BA88EBB
MILRGKLMKYCLNIGLALALSSAPLFGQRPEALKEIGIDHPTLLKSREIFPMNIDSAYHYLKAAQKDISQENLKIQSAYYAYLADAEIHRGKLNLARAYLDFSKNLLDSTANPLLFAHNQYYEALYLRESQQLPAAISAALIALRVFENHQDSSWIALSNRLASGIFYLQGNLEDALAYLERSIAINNALNLESELAADFHNKALILVIQGNVEESFSLLQKAKNLNLKNHNLGWLGRNYHALAYHYQREDYSKCEQYIDSASSTYRQIPDLGALINLKFFEARLKVRQGFYKRADSILESIREMSTDELFLIKAAEYYQVKAHLKAHLEKWEEAFNLQNRYLSIQDSLDHLEHQAALEIYKTLHNSIIERDKLEKESEHLQYLNSKQRYIAIYVSVLLILGALFIYQLYRNQRLKGRQLERERNTFQRDLEFRDQELSAIALNQAEEAQWKQSIMARLEDEIQKPGPVKADSLKKMLADLRRSANSKNQWEEFEMRFKRVHPSFYDKLQGLAPDLSPAELKICALLRLNLSTKEIAALLHKSVKGLEVDRARIRKKLGLTHSKENLTKFILSI